MIRLALILLGFSASGLGAAAVEPSIEGELAGGYVAALTADDAPALDSDGAAPTDVVHPVKFTRRSAFGCMTVAHDVDLMIGVVPFDRSVTAKGIMDGSDPSADFCP